MRSIVMIRIYFTSMVFIFTLFGSASFAQTIPPSPNFLNSPHINPHMGSDLEEERQEYIEEQERDAQQQAYEAESAQTMENVQDSIQSQQDEISQDTYIPQSEDDVLSEPESPEEIVPRSFSPPQ